MKQNDNVSLDDKWTVTSGRVLMNGTQALARVLLAQAWLDRREGLDTAGYITGYRGSPLGNVDNTLWSIGKRLDEAGIKFVPGVNEDLAATAVAGTQQIDQLPGAKYDGVFSAWYGKGPGVDRAGDAFKHGNYAGASKHGGVVLFYGEDHAGKSSTVAYQSDQAIAANLIPSFYPATVGEILQYGLFALALSRHAGIWTAVKCVNEVVEQNASTDIDLDGFSPALPPVGDVPPEGLHAALRAFDPLRAEKIVIENRLPLVIPFVRANGIDRPVFRAEQPRLAIVSAGKTYGDVMQALSILGLDEQGAAQLGVSLYKVGCIWPLDGEAIADFARGHETVLVAEEKKSFIEAQLAEAFVNRTGMPRLIGKKDEDGAPLLSSVLPLEPVQIAKVILDRLGRLGLATDGMAQATACLSSVHSAAPNAPAIKRSPFFCSGCPHNRSTKVPEGSMSITGIGCHFMTIMARPEKSIIGMQMGAEGANWMGIAPFTDTPHIFQNMGDGTYYHSGLLAIRAAIASGVNITYKILYNDAVAMTGGQPVDGPLSVAEIAQQVRHEGAKRIAIVSDNPDWHRQEGGLPPGVTISHREELDNVQRELREVSGCSVLIYEQTCAAEKRRRRKRGNFPNPAKRMFIAEEVCEGCGDCSVQSTCVSIVPRETAFGRKRAIDQSSCNKDYSCNDGFCPSFITVHGAEPRKPEGVAVGDETFAGLSSPRVADGACNIMVAGIGGTGVITVGALIGMAAHMDGRAASLYDMTGLAQKNGAVYSHIRIADTPADIHTQRLGRGEADVLLAFDMVAALQPESDATLAGERTQAIANTAVVPTFSFQLDRDAVPEPEVLLARLGERIGRDAVTMIDASDLALRLLGDTIGANLMVVGMAAQRGLLPVSVESLEKAIALNGVAVTFNINAFRLGRLFVADPDRVLAMLPDAAKTDPVPETLDEIVDHRAAHLCVYQNEALAARYRARVEEVKAAEHALYPGSETLSRVFARNYAKLIAIKDEYEVARMLTDPALRERIEKTFQSGARIGFNLAPPILPGKMPNGRPRKREFPAWFALPALRVLKSMKGLRGSILDIFGHSAERRSERRLLADYDALVDRVLARLTRENLADAVAVLDEVSSVRGFGPVKEVAMATYYRRIELAERKLGAVRPAAPPVDRGAPLTA